MELFIQNGYHSTSIDEIANKAKISKGLLYNKREPSCTNFLYYRGLFGKRQ
ncbi:helix-turn-helix domain-containing protein [Chengkuizengella sp. SCS-71B]|uniref:helix-turn-helix domain-containing protein n=1 Tax=Chengkuizengella sp. SCS-71B TaxID=3115290 RepID=UPI0032C24733